MDPAISLRKATLGDVSEMTEVLQSAFSSSIFNGRCFPSDDPESKAYWMNCCKGYINDSNNHVIIAEEEAPQGSGNPSKILGWTRWAPRQPVPKDAPRRIIGREGFPAKGDVELGVRFFQGSVDVMRELLADFPVWFLSTMVVRTDAQRRGVGGRLMQYGCDKADEVGWKCALNASGFGKGLYEKFGFRTARIRDYGDGIIVYAMLREVNGAV